MEFKGSKTEKNLLAAFAGESQAKTKYEFYAQEAKKDGFEQMAAIFYETAHNEGEHAKLWFKALHNGEMTHTKENLADAAAGEHYEWTEMYKDFAETAREEGFDELGYLFESVGKIENTHEVRYNTLRDNLEEGIVFSRTEETLWLCRNCGYIHTGKTAPAVCPVCAHKQAFFEIQKENY